jgi:hypothetical protein
VRFATLDSVACDAGHPAATSVSPVTGDFVRADQQHDTVLGGVDYQFTGGGRLGIRYNYSQNTPKVPFRWERA